MESVPSAQCVDRDRLKQHCNYSIKRYLMLTSCVIRPNFVIAFNTVLKSPCVFFLVDAMMAKPFEMPVTVVASFADQWQWNCSCLRRLITVECSGFLVISRGGALHKRSWFISMNISTFCLLHTWSCSVPLTHRLSEASQEINMNVAAQKLLLPGKIQIFCSIIAYSHLAFYSSYILKKYKRPRESPF